MSNTGIDYATKSWNIVHGCDPVSEGCQRCWAKGMAARLRGRAGYPVENNGFAVTIRPDRLLEPLGWKEPERVAVGFMGDLFHPKVPREFIFRVLDIAVQAHLERGHMFLFLAKRVRRMRHLVTAYVEGGHVCGAGPFCREQHGGKGCPLPEGLLFGCSVENQFFTWRILELLRVPGRLWVSIEPMLSPVYLRKIGGDRFGWGRVDALAGLRYVRANAMEHGCEWETESVRRLSHVALGCESGPGARYMDEDWVRKVRDDCVETGVPFYYKQRRENGRVVHLPELDGRVWDQLPDLAGVPACAG